MIGDRNEARLNDTTITGGTSSVGGTPVSATPLDTTTTVVATVPSGYQYIVKQVIMCNTDTQDRVLSLAIGSAATLANRFVSLLPIAGFDTIILDTGLVLNAGETIQGLSDTGAKVNVTVVGWTKQTA
jgi:hypothetical protein